MAKPGKSSFTLLQDCSDHNILSSCRSDKGCNIAKTRQALRYVGSFVRHRFFAPETLKILALKVYAFKQA